MNQESLEFLKEMIKSPSPSGFEQAAAEIWAERTKKFADEIKTDLHGNSIALLKGAERPRVMLAGHIDEIGYMIKYIDKEGYLYFSPVGGIDLHLVPGQRVWIYTAKGKLLGVIGKKPIHLMEAEERKTVAKIDQLWIDIGAKDEEEAKILVSIGDCAVPAVGFEMLQNRKAVGRGFDDKAGAFTVSETLRLLAGKKERPTVYGVATVQEEVGLRGAKTSAFGLSPDVGIAIDVTFASDFPGMNKKKNGEISLGKGPVIARGPNINPKVFDLLVKAAEDNDIPYQVEGIPRGTGTDANVIQLTRSGVAAGLVSIPNRYMHTPVEVIDLTDLENTSLLLAAFISGIDENTDFLPF